MLLNEFVIFLHQRNNGTTKQWRDQIMKRYNVYKEGRLYGSYDTIDESINVAMSLYITDVECLSVIIWDTVEDCEVL